MTKAEMEQRIERLELIVAGLDLKMTLRTNPTGYEIERAQREHVQRKTRDRIVHAQKDVLL